MFPPSTPCFFSKADLQQLVDYREEMQERLSYKVATLENLNEILNLLQELNDRDNTIDEVYLPVENSYMMLRYDRDLRQIRPGVGIQGYFIMSVYR